MKRSPITRKTPMKRGSSKLNRTAISRKAIKSAFDKDTISFQKDLNDKMQSKGVYGSFVTLKRTPMRRQSKRGRDGQTAYQKARKEFLAEHPYCIVHLIAKGQKKPATEVHHAKGRIGSFLTDKRFFLPVCHDCHLSVEASFRWASEHGFSFEKGKTIHDAAHADKCLEYQLRVRI